MLRPGLPEAYTSVLSAFFSEFYLPPVFNDS